MLCGAFAASLALPPAAEAAPQKKSAKKAKKPVKKKAPAIDTKGEFVNFGQWKEVQQFMDEMVSKHGFQRSELEALLRQVNYVDSAVQLVKPAPPGKPKNWQAYSSRFIEPIRINAGVRFWNENQDALARAESLYGVPAEIIVGIIGVETIYGVDTGKFRTMDALTTLAFAYPLAPNRDARMAFFRSELESTLLYARQTGIDPLSLLGSYAGAVGMPQFMPGNIVKYAVDFDGDGRIDLRNSASDAIGSVAAFLVGHGWRRDDPGPLVYTARVSPSRAWEKYINQGLEAKFRADDLIADGVVTTSSLPPEMLYGLVDLQNGSEPTEYWVATNNFFTITQYNRSYFYAMSVVELGRAVKLSRRAP
ncbi:lytic murein transglycosylase B [Pseudoduganella rhizocola]|uniref:lytic murein transglycosylase B n=1 Tax=Pseudoduganella rhizocola TaxID=3382643 RepID=UPI0038B4D67A